MKRNADFPAYPIYMDTPLVGEGLSKREHIAALVLAGLASNGDYEPHDGAAVKALALADALLHRLAQPRAVGEHTSNGEPPF